MAQSHQMDLEPKAKAQAEPRAEEPSAPETAIVPVAAGGDEPSRVLSAFANEGAFTVAQRMAKALAASSLLPETFRGNIPNCMIAMEMANRVGCSVFMICQNMDVIHGRPSFRAKFLIATVNASGRFSPLRFRWQGKEGADDWGCRAYATDLKTGEECVGPLITIGLAKGEAWYSKSGSKWKTMPEKMLMYRSGAWWSDLYCPEFGMGMSTREEIIDTYGESIADAPTSLTPGSTKALEAELMAGNGAPAIDRETGEVIQ